MEQRSSVDFTFDLSDLPVNIIDTNGYVVLGGFVLHWLCRTIEEYLQCGDTFVNSSISVLSKIIPHVCNQNKLRRITDRRDDLLKAQRELLRARNPYAIHEPTATILYYWLTSFARHCIIKTLTKPLELGFGYLSD